MRKAFARQRRLDCPSIDKVELNLKCRHELIPVLRALQHIYSRPEVRDGILDLIAEDVNRDSRSDCGREGFDYWQVLVLAAVRLGCNLNYDQLQDLAEEHRKLRHIMGIGQWDEKTSFNWQRIRDNVCLLRPRTIDVISQAIVAEGHRLDPDAAKKVRADSFVAETNVHWPSESSLIRDGLQKIITICVALSAGLNLGGWRQHSHLLAKVSRLACEIDRIASKKGANYQARLKARYHILLKLSGRITRRARKLVEEVESRGSDAALLAELHVFLQRTEHVRDTARRRVLKGEQVPNSEKLFSMFEPHTQLYKRGKAGEPMQFGRLVMIYEDAAGFIVHHHVLSREATDASVVVEQTGITQERLGGRIEEASFDRGFHSPENQVELAKIISHPCLPTRGAKQAAAQAASATVQFRAARQRHPGIESAIGALQSGNGLKRCRDRTEIGFARYVSLGILGRNLHVLGKLLIAQEDPDCQAAGSQRRKPAA
jgi:transposase, IS5 family